MSQNLYELLAAALNKNTDKTLITLANGEQITRRQVLARAAQIAHLLRDNGLQPGDRVSVQIDKSALGVCLYLACLQAGLVYHPLNTAYQRAELEFFLTDAKPAAVIYSAAYAPALTALCDELNIGKRWQLNGDDSGSLADAIAELPTAFTTQARAADDMAALLYSSGTTGRPKGIMLSHQNLASNALALVSAWGFSENDQLLHMLPLYHVHGLFVALHCVLLSGASVVLLPRFDTASALQWLPRCSVMMGVPTFYTRLLDSEFERSHAANVRLFISGSAPLLAETFSAFEARIGQPILERYGMTETGMNTSNPLNGARKAGTVGLPLAGVELRLVDDDNQPVAAGEVGNIQVKGANVFVGYWQLPEKTAQDMTADGYFDTGDKGQLDADGYLSIVGRAKDMVISGGLNIYPKEIERVIDELDGVLESAVIGVPHADFGEALVAVVVAKPQASAEQVAEATLKQALKPQLAAFKQPKRVLLVDKLPRNSMGKVQKAALRQQYATLFKQ